jgi:hypothetical protein
MLMIRQILMAITAMAMVLRFAMPALRPAKVGRPLRLRPGGAEQR